MRFLVDTQLPAALARWLQDKGHEAEHVLDVGLAQSKDNPVWHYAAQHEAVIVTKDEDFAEGARRSSVVWLRLGNSSKLVLLTWLDPLSPLIILKLQQGDRLIEVR